MDIPAAPSSTLCQQCHEQVDLDFDFTMAFQPIVDCSKHCSGLIIPDTVLGGTVATII